MADITTGLSRIADSFVISASTAFTYKNRQVDPKQIGKQLGVRYVLQGSVRRAGDHAQVNVELIDTTNGAQIWAERFDHDVIDSAAFQDHVTSQIGRELGIELVEAESRRSGQRRPDSRDAVDFAMQGWSILNQPPDRRRMQEARTHFEASLSRDAAHGSALVGLALTYVLEVEFWAPSQAEDFSSRAEDAVNRALALDFKASYAHQVKARIAGFRLQIPEAATEARRAIQLDRNDWKSHVLLSLYELMAGRPEQACLLADKALRLSPRDPGIWAPLCLLGRARVVLGEPAAAIDPLQQAVSCAPGAAFLRVFLAAAYGRAGYEYKARACISEFLRMSPDLMVGHSDEVQMIMRSQLELAAQGYYLGLIDGRLGPMNHQALITFQREHRISETGAFDEPTLCRLKVAGR